QSFAPKIIFPVHPRTKKKLDEFHLIDRVQNNSALQLIDPIGYLSFLALQDSAAIVLTDSGGIQEETTYLGVPCITLRENTERPVTVSSGTNTIAGTQTERIRNAIKAQTKSGLSARAPEKWDGRAGGRIVEAILHDLKFRI